MEGDISTSMECGANEFDLSQLFQIERINVVGTSGSGKTTFSRELSSLLDLPLVEMDRVFWGPNWQETPDDEFVFQIEKKTECDQWVLDGNYTRTTSAKWRYVQLVVWLDTSFARTLFRVANRSIKRSISREEFWPHTGNRETLRKAFLSKDSIVLWAITSFSRNRQHYSKVMASDDYSPIKFVRLRSQSQVNRFLDAARAAAKQRQ